MTTWRSAGGLLLEASRAGMLEPISWTTLTLSDGLSVRVSTDAVRARVPDATRPLRLPVSWNETIEIARAQRAVPPTQDISDAIWRAAPIKLQPYALVRNDYERALMMTLEFSIRHNVKVEQLPLSPGVLVADVGKDWLLHPEIPRSGAVNYGWRQPSGVPIQPVGHAHGPTHFDYSQVLRLVHREAEQHGACIDLLDYLDDKIPKPLLDLFR